MNIPSQYVMAESNPSDTVQQFRLTKAFASGLTTPAGADFNRRIAAELARIGSPLTLPNSFNAPRRRHAPDVIPSAATSAAEPRSLHPGSFSNTSMNG